MLAYFEQWHFDWVSSIATLIIGPFVVYSLVVARRVLKDFAKYIIDGFVYALNKTIIHRAAASLTLKRYCRLQLAGPSQYLHVPASIEIGLDIDTIFVPLILENRGMNAVFSNTSVLTAGNRIRIIGDPGSGKSSAAKWIFRDECKRALSTPGKSRFPVLLELRALVVPKNISDAKLGDWMLDYIRLLCAKHDVYNLEKCFDIYTNKSGLLVILDGLDEVSSSAFARIQAAINALSVKLQQLGEHNVIIMTIRTQFHHQIKEFFDVAFPIVLAVKRFSPSDIYQFLMSWPFSINKIDTVVRIYNDLTDRPTLREMCTNPLVLSMYVAQDQASGYQIAPDSRTEFYSKVVDELLIRRRAKQLGSIEAQAIVRDQRQRILGSLALDHLRNEQQSLNLLSWKDGVNAVMVVTGIEGYSEAEEFFRDLAKETGLITEERERETFRFIHLTFCEFFCAYESVHGKPEGWELLISAHQRFSANPTSRSRLAEVLPFAAALTPRHMRAQCLENLATCCDSRLLALAFLETKLYSHPLWEQFVDRSIANLLARPEAGWDADWLRDLHLFLVVASDAERAASVAKSIRKPNGVAILFRDLADRTPSPIARLIRSYARQDAAAAFRVATLCNVDLLRDMPEVVIENCDQPAFLAIALERASREVDRSETWACLFAEAGLRSAATATALANRTDRYWSSSIDKIPRNNWWSFSTLAKPSLYTDCLTIARTSPGSSARTPLLNEFRVIPGPSNDRLRSPSANFFQRHGTWLAACFYIGGTVSMFALPFSYLGPAMGGLGLLASASCYANTIEDT